MDVLDLPGTQVRIIIVQYEGVSSQHADLLAKADAHMISEGRKVKSARVVTDLSEDQGE